MPVPHPVDQARAVILFDGVCNLCNGAVTFVIGRDPHAYFAFAPLQSETGQELLGGTATLKSIVLIEEGKRYTGSTAALRVAKRLRNPWPLLYGFIIVPEALRDGLYSFIAAHRYRWFG